MHCLDITTENFSLKNRKKDYSEVNIGNVLRNAKKEKTKTYRLVLIYFFFSALLIYTFSSQQDIAENLDIDHWENKRGPRPWEE